MYLKSLVEALIVPIRVVLLINLSQINWTSRHRARFSILTVAYHAGCDDGCHMHKTPKYNQYCEAVPREHPDGHNRLPEGEGA